MNNSVLAPETVEQIIINGYDLSNLSKKAETYTVVTDEPQDGDSYDVPVIFFPVLRSEAEGIIYVEDGKEFESEYDAMYWVAKYNDPDHEAYDKDSGEYWSVERYWEYARKEYEMI